MEQEEYCIVLSFDCGGLVSRLDWSVCRDAFLLSWTFCQRIKVYVLDKDVKVTDKTLSRPEVVRKGRVYLYWAFTNGGKNFKSKASPEVDLDHQYCFEQRDLKVKERLLQY